MKIDSNLPAHYLKMTLSFFLYVGFALIVPVFFAMSQEGETDTTAAKQGKEAKIGFDKLLNRYHWETRFHYETGGEALSLFINQKFLSSLIKTERMFIRDEHFLDAKATHYLSKNIHGVLNTSSYVLSDDQSIAISKAGSHSVQYGVEMIPFEKFRVTPMVGARFENQLGEHDNGALYSLLLGSSGLRAEGYDVTIGGSNEVAFLSPRISETIRDTIGFRKSFFERSQMNITFSYLHSRRDFYLNNNQSPISAISELPDIESRTESGMMFNGGFTYAAINGWQFVLQGVLLNRNIGRALSSQNSSQGSAVALSPNINEFRLEGNAMAMYSPSRPISITGGITLTEREEIHSIFDNGGATETSIDSATRIQERKNNRANRAALFINCSYNASRSDTFNLSLSNNLLRYDTPTLLNDDDRDELRHSIRLTSTHHLLSNLSLNVISEVSLSHLVYLGASRSSENTWNRIFRLSPALYYQPTSSLETMNTFEVLANYTVYDYEYLSSSVRSFTFRQFAWTDSTVYQATNRVALEWNSNIRLYERGELQWEEFSERPLTYIEEHTYVGSVRYSIRERLLFSVGIRYFSQTRYSYAGSEKQEDFYLRSVGPVSSIEWSVGERTRLRVNGWFENLLQTNQTASSNANMTMECLIRL